MSYMALEVAPFCTRVLAPFYLRVSSTISFGEERIFRLRPHGGNGKIDLPVGHGTVVVIPYETNREWTHEVTKSRSHAGKRISVTMRAFI